MESGHVPPGGHVFGPINFLAVLVGHPVTNFIDLAFQKAEKNFKPNNAIALSYYHVIINNLSNLNFR